MKPGCDLPPHRKYCIILYHTQKYSCRCERVLILLIVRQTKMTKKVKRQFQKQNNVIHLTVHYNQVLQQLLLFIEG